MRAFGSKQFHARFLQSLQQLAGQIVILIRLSVR